MSTTADSVTSITLLRRLQQTPSDQAAWAEFVARYGWRVQRWCRDWGLQEADCHDVAQTVLLKLLKAMQRFRYDPSHSFRAWLKTIAQHVWQDLLRSRRKTVEGGNAESGDPVQALAARDNLGEQLEAAYEQELLECALARVRPRVQSQTWEAFHLTVFEDLPGAEAAAQLGMAVTSVYKAKSNVLKLLVAEVHYLEGGET